MFDRLKNIFFKKREVPQQPTQYRGVSELLKALDVISVKDASMLRRIDEAWNRLMGLSYERMKRYKDYEQMIEDGWASRALTVTIDHAFPLSETLNRTMWVESYGAEKDRYTEEGLKLFDRIGMEDKIWDWAFQTAFYGDLFIQPMTEKGEGIVAVEEGFKPELIDRIEWGGQLVGFQKRTEGSAKPELLKPWDFVHFMASGGVNLKKAFLTKVEIKNERDQKKEGEINIRYGTSILEGARQAFNRYSLAESTLLLARLANSIRTILVFIDVSGLDKQKAEQLIDKYQELIGRRQFLRLGESLEVGRFPAEYTPLFVPVMGTRGEIKMDSVGGNMEVRGIVDVEMLRDKFLGALNVPKDVLLGERTSETTLTRSSVLFAKTVKRVRRSIVLGIMRLLQIHYGSLGMDTDPRRFSVKLEAISSIEEDEKGLVASGSIDNFEKVYDFLKRFAEEKGKEIDKDYLLQYAKKSVKLSGFDFEEALKDKEEVPKPKAEVEAPEEVKIQDKFGGDGKEALLESLYRGGDLNALVR